MGLYFTTALDKTSNRLGEYLAGVGRWYGFELDVVEGRVVILREEGNGRASAADSAAFKSAVQSDTKHDFDVDAPRLREVLGSEAWNSLFYDDGNNMPRDAMEANFIQLAGIRKGVLNTTAVLTAPVAIGGTVVAIAPAIPLLAPAAAPLVAPAAEAGVVGGAAAVPAAQMYQQYQAQINQLQSQLTALFNQLRVTGGEFARRVLSAQIRNVERRIQELEEQMRRF